MPEINDYQLHLQGVGDLLLQRSSSSQGCFSRCYSCLSGVKSEFFGACLDCREHYQDGKPGDAKAPLLVEAPFWGACNSNAPAPSIGVTVPEDHVPVPFAPPSTRVTRRRSSPISRDHVVPCARSSCRSPSSPYRTQCSQRGRPPNGSRPPPGFKGVRQRKGVRGFLVEIRPPKWKRTIWLGTYNTDREAAGAYDAGIFYTNKKTKYNFPHLRGTFPALPSKLRLDDANDSDEIKTFVQKEARLAALKVKSLPQTSSQSGPAVAVAASTTTTTTSGDEEECSEPRETSSAENVVATPLVLPMDEEWLNNLDLQTFLFDDLVGHVSFHPGVALPQPSSWQSSPFELKQELITLDHDGFAVNLT